MFISFNNLSSFILLILNYCILINSQSISYNEQQQSDLLTKLVSDIKTNQQQYIQFFQTANNVPIPLNLIGSLNQITTYTDDSYIGSLLTNSDILSQVDNIATQLPWYNDRLADSNIPSLITSSTTIDSSSSSSNTSKKSSGLGNRHFNIFDSFSISLIYGLLLSI
ncbi:hypothetical protein KGF54_000297 [Candida jiufengensis]|uniref:uncharacterized protein n=1 Tax=Candida jiufengensis TaxID=497108 RepID=UPI002225404D|nr:uncharacterized protein KGF54_000297 [Candida jiufengensis]KAI5957369.1 hypothetical protein KGF54_000297 [Candida jiufengensis]